MDSAQPPPSTPKSPLSLSPASQVALGPAEQASFPLLSPGLSDAGGTRMDDEELKHKVGTTPSRGLDAGGPGLAHFRPGSLGWGGAGALHTPLPLGLLSRRQWAGFPRGTSSGSPGLSGTSRTFVRVPGKRGLPVPGWIPGK